MASSTTNACGEVIMWKKPWSASLVLLCGTFIYHQCTVRNLSIVTLICNVLLVFFLLVGSLGIYFRRRNERLPVDLSKFEVSSETANHVVAFFANTVGATEGVLRVAASGSDYKLFIKVVVVLYASAAIGRAASGGTVAYMALWMLFTLPICLSKLAPEGTGSKLQIRQGSGPERASKVTNLNR